MPRHGHTPRFYFSFRSPYSWLAYHDLRTDYPWLLETLEWRPFWEPDARSLAALTAAGGDFPYTVMTRRKHLYVLLDVRRLASARGLSVTWPIDRDPCWEVPHLAYLAAAAAGRGPEFVERVYGARWRDGHDICDPDVISGLGDDVGVSGLGTAAEDDASRAAGVSALLAVDADGVFGVPFFVNGHDKYWGVDRLPAFAAALRNTQAPRVLTPTRPSLLSDLPSDLAFHDTARADDGHAGGCG